MKKTLVTLAALAMASVASAVTLDFTNTSTLPTEPVTFAGDSTDRIILAGLTTTNASTVKDEASGATITIADSKYFFGTHDGMDKAALHGATIDFGTTGKLIVDQPQSLNLYGQALTFTGQLETTVYTDDSSKWGTTELVTRSLIECYWKWDIYNREGNNDSFTTSFTGVDGSTVDYEVLNSQADGERFMVALQYTVTYAEAPSVPEPATATLSLLALAGLAARRRRK